MKETELSSLSFTNKDFFDIYPELLTLAKQLSASWDPSTSNEADPGVVLIKEMAILADRINYNSDKNALENYPLSATQLKSVRQLYDILGYQPGEYKSSVIKMQFMFTGDTSAFTDERAIIPRFTQFSNFDGSVNFVLTEDVDINLANKQSSFGDAIQGTVTELKINGSSNITLACLDDFNRVFLNSNYVAQNGIFVISSDGISTRVWDSVDNIYSQDLGSHVYKFGTDPITGNHFIQFPDDIASIISDSLKIYYIVSAGNNGNVSVNSITNLSDATITAQLSKPLASGETTLDLSSDNLFLTNTETSVVGKDPETIDEMYRSWKRTAGTFDTLVTLRDYTNALISLDPVSNGFVTDRTNDPQVSYKIVTEQNDFSSTSTIVESDSSGKKEMDAFSLKLYALQNMPADATKYSAFNKSFSIYSDLDPNVLGSKTNQIAMLLEDFKCIQHDYSKILPDKIAYIRAKYNIQATIQTTQKLSDIQKQSIKQNIAKSIYSSLNAEEVSFGESIDETLVINVIKNSDNRITGATLDPISFDAYAEYFDSKTNQWSEVCVSDSMRAYIKGYYNSSSKKFYQDAEFTKPLTITIAQLCIDMITENVYVYTGVDFDLISDKRKEFRKEILCKNILAGITPLIVTDDYNFNFSLAQSLASDSAGNPIDEFITGAKAVSAETYYDLQFDSTQLSNLITVADNELIQFYKPLMETVTQFGSGVHYIYFGVSVIQPNQDFTIPAGEYLVVFFKEAENDTRYKCVKFYPGSIVNFNFKPTTQTIDNLGIMFPTTAPKSGYAIQYSAISNNATYNTNTSSQAIDIKEIKQTVLDQQCNYCYFITNNIITENDQNYYVLNFEAGKPITLGNKEQFIVTDQTRQSLKVFSAGTKLVSSNSIQLKAPVIDPQYINLYGVNILEDYWVQFSGGTSIYSTTITATQQEYYNATQGDKIEFIINTTPTSQAKYKITANGIETDNSTFGQRFTHLNTSININNSLLIKDEYVEKIKDLITFLTGENFINDCSGTIKFESENINIGAYLESDFKTSDGFRVIDKKKWDSLASAGTEPFASIPYPYKWNCTFTGTSGNNTSGVALYHFSSANPAVSTFLEAFASGVKENAPEYAIYIPGFDVVDGGIASSTIDGSWVPGTGFTLEYNFTSGANSSVALSNFDVKISDGDTGETIKTIAGSFGDTSYSIAAFVNLQFDKINKQKISKNETIKFYADEAKTALIREVIGSASEDKFILSNTTINVLNTVSSTLSTYFDEYGNEKYPTFFIFSNAELHSGVIGTASYYVIENSGALTITVDNTTGTSDQTFSTGMKIIDSTGLIKGNYICRIYNNTNNFSELYFKLGDNYLYKINSNPKSYDIHKSGIYYTNSFGSESASVVNKELTLFGTILAGKKATLEISPLTRYNFSDIVENLTSEAVMQKIADLDKNNIYNYMTQVDEGKKIENPLDGSSFMNKNHFYNKFSIPQAYAPAINAK